MAFWLQESLKDNKGARVYACDATSDVANLPIHIAAGSWCLVIETGEIYQLNSQKTWTSSPGQSAGSYIYSKYFD